MGVVYIVERRHITNNLESFGSYMVFENKKDALACFKEKQRKILNLFESCVNSDPMLDEEWLLFLREYDTANQDYHTIVRWDVMVCSSE